MFITSNIFIDLTIWTFFLDAEANIHHEIFCPWPMHLRVRDICVEQLSLSVGFIFFNDIPFKNSSSSSSFYLIPCFHLGAWTSFQSIQVEKISWSNYRLKNHIAREYMYRSCVLYMMFWSLARYCSKKWHMMCWTKRYKSLFTHSLWIFKLSKMLSTN